MEKSFIDKMTYNTILICAIVFCICIIYFKKINIFLGFTVALLICYGIYYNQQLLSNNDDALHQIKLDNIRPIPKKKIGEYKNFTDFIFSIQEFYVYNPQTYENMVDAIDIFIEIYEDTKINNALSGEYYALAESQKLLALNALHSVIMMIPSSKLLIKKLNDACKTLEELMNNYLFKIYEYNKKYIKENGYFNNSKIIDLNISPYNKYLTDHYDQYY